MKAIAICPVCKKRIELHARKDFESFTAQEAVEHIMTEHPEAVTDFGVPYIRIDLTDTTPQRTP